MGRSGTDEEEKGHIFFLLFPSFMYVYFKSLKHQKLDVYNGGYEARLCCKFKLYNCSSIEYHHLIWYTSLFLQFCPL